MNELTLPLRGLRARPLRTLLTVIGIAVAVAGFVALTGLTAGVQQSFASGINENGADLVVSQRSAFNLVSSTVPRSLEPALAADPGVEAVSGVLLNITTADEDGEYRHRRLAERQLPVERACPSSRGACPPRRTSGP